MPSPRMLTRAQTGALTFGVGIALGLMLAMMSQAVPLADDIHRANPDNLHFWSALRGIYLGWSGRVTGIGMELAILPRIDLIHGYFPLLLAIAFIHLLAFYSVVRTAFHSAITRPQAAGAALLLLAILFTSMPSPGDTLFWVSGALEIQLAVSLSLLLLSALCARRIDTVSSPVWKCIAAGLALLTLFIGLEHEVFAVTLLIALGVGLCIAWGSTPARRRLWVIVTVAALTAVILSLSAPGNWKRLDQTQQLGSLMDSEKLNAVQMIKWVETWITDVRLLALTLLLVLSPSLLRSNPPWVRLFAGWKRWLLPLGLTLIVLAGFSMPTLAVGRGAPWRIADGLFTAFLFGWLLTAFVFSRPSAQLAGKTTEPLGAIVCLVASLILGVALALGNNSDRARVDLRRIDPATGDLAIVAWRAAVIDRFAMAQAHLGDHNTDLIFEPLPEAPSLYFFGGDLRCDPNDWHNTSFANLFGIRSVKVISATPLRTQSLPDRPMP